MGDATPLTEEFGARNGFAKLPRSSIMELDLSLEATAPKIAAMVNS
jgi:hypothetical protein